MKNKSVKLLTSAAMFAALTLALTYFHTPMPNANGGYVHLGDAVIFLAASILPLPYACAAAAVGGAMADLLSGFAVWAPATLIIKALLALCFTSKQETILCKRNYFAAIGTFIFTIGGYYLAEGIIYGNFTAPAASIVGNLTQWLGSWIVYLLVAVSLDKAGFKKSITKNM